MDIRGLTIQEMAATGATHEAVVKAADLTEAAVDTAQVLKLLTVKPGQLVELIKDEVKTAFEDVSDAAFNSTAVTVGDTADADRLLTSQQVNANGTTVTGKAGAGAYVYTAETDVNLTVGSMAAKALADIDSGELTVLLKVV